MYSIHVYNITIGPNYPRQVLAIDSTNSGQVVGMESGQGAPLSIPSSSPVVVDTIERQVYYYNSAVRTLFKSPLNGSPSVDVSQYHAILCMYVVVTLLN